MANPAQAHSHEQGHGHGAGSHGHGEGHHVNYFKIYWILVVLLFVSIAGPEFGHKAVTLVTAFGIAIVKAYLVAANFMHLKFEKKYIAYLMLTALAFMGIFYAGVSPDVMNHHGRGWVNVAAKQETARALKEQAERKAHGDGHGHGDDGKQGEHDGHSHGEH